MLASGELPRLRVKRVELEGELGVAAVLAERLGLPHITGDVSEDYFSRENFDGGKTGDESKRMDDCFGDGEFDVEE